MSTRRIPVERTSTVSSSTPNPDLVSTKTETAEARSEALKQMRQAYRMAALQEGNFATATMSDDAIDTAIAIQQTQPYNTAEYNQGKSAEEVDALRRRREQAVQLADIYNQNSPFTVSPYISPEFAYQNPDYVEGVMHDAAMVLPYAFWDGATFGLGSATSAIGNGLRIGWNTAGNLATRSGQAIRTAGQMAKPIVTNPRWITTTGLTGLYAADALANATAESSNNSGNNVGTVLGTTLLIGAGTTVPWLIAKKVHSRKSSKNKSGQGKNSHFFWERPQSYYTNKQHHYELINEFDNLPLITADNYDDAILKLGKKVTTKQEEATIAKELKNIKSQEKIIAEESAKEIKDQAIIDNAIASKKQSQETINDIYSAIDESVIETRIDNKEYHSITGRNKSEKTPKAKRQRALRNTGRIARLAGLAATTAGAGYTAYSIYEDKPNSSNSETSKKEETNSKEEKKEEKKEPYKETTRIR